MAWGYISNSDDARGNDDETHRRKSIIAMNETCEVNHVSLVITVTERSAASKYTY